MDTAVLNEYLKSDKVDLLTLIDLRNYYIEESIRLEKELEESGFGSRQWRVLNAIIEQKESDLDLICWYIGAIQIANKLEEEMGLI